MSTEQTSKTLAASGVLAALPDGDKWLANAVTDPMWAEAGRVHDWRNYVPDVIKTLWPHLSEEARLVAVVMADQEASNERWD